MAATLSAPNAIKDIYKKLVFFDEVSIASPFEFQYTNASTLDDIAITEVRNEFDFKNTITFSGTVTGDQTFYQYNLDIMQLISDIYGTAGQTVDSEHKPYLNNLGTILYGLNQASFGDIMSKEKELREEKDLEHDVELNQVERLLTGDSAGWAYSDYMTEGGSGPEADNPWLNDPALEPATKFIDSDDNLLGTSPEGIIPALQVLDAEIAHNRSWIETMWNWATGADDAATSAPDHPGAQPAGYGIFDPIHLNLTNRYYISSQGPGPITNLAKPDGTTYVAASVENLQDTVELLDTEVRLNEVWLNKIDTLLLDTNSINTTTSPTWPAQTDNWSRNSSGDTGTFLSDATVTSFLQAIKEIDYELKNIWNRIDLDFNSAAQTNAGNQAYRTNRRSIDELNTDINALCVQIGTTTANTNAGTPVYDSPAGAIYATGNVIKTDIDSLDQRLEDTTQDLYNQTGSNSWNSGAANVAYNSSAMTDLQGLKYMLGTMQTNIGLTSTDSVTDGTYTSDALNTYGVANIIKSDIAAIDAELKVVKVILTGGSTAGDTYDTSSPGTTGDNVETNINNIQTEIDNIETGAGLETDGTYATLTGVYTTGGSTIKGNLNSIEDQVEALTTMLTGDTVAGDQYDTSGTTGDNVELNINNIQAEVDAIEAQVGLATDGTYTSHSGNVYAINDQMNSDIDSLDGQLADLTTQLTGATTAGSTQYSSEIGSATVEGDVNWLYDTLYDGGGGAANNWPIATMVNQIVNSTTGKIEAKEDLDMKGFQIKDVASPSVSGDAATKGYVDDGIAGFVPSYNAKVATAQIADAAGLIADGGAGSPGKADPVGGLMAIDTSDNNPPAAKTWDNKGTIFLVDTSAGSVEYEHGGIAYDDATKAPKTITTSPVYIDGIEMDDGDYVLITGEALTEVDGATWRESTAQGEQGWHWRNGMWKFCKANSDIGDGNGRWMRPDTGLIWATTGTRDIGMGTYHPVKEGYQNGLTIMQAVDGVELGASSPDYPTQSVDNETSAGLVAGGDGCSAWSYFQGITAPMSGNVTHVENGSEIHLDFHPQHFEIISASPDYLSLLLAGTSTNVSQLEIPFTVSASGLSLSVDNNYFSWDGYKLALSATQPVTGTSLAVNTTTLTANLVSGKVGIGTASPAADLTIQSAGTTPAVDGLLIEEGPTDILAIHSGGNGYCVFDALYSAGTNDFVFRAAGTEKMRISSAGNITLTGTVDGRDIDTDGTKLDGIDESANAYSHPTNYNGDDFSVDTGVLTGATVVSDIDINVTTDTTGHVSDANGSVSTRTLTLADLNYTGSTTANDYSHPDVIVTDQVNLTGATVISGVGTTDEGHVDALTTRNLTAANLGVVVASDSVTDGITTFNQYDHPATTAGGGHLPDGAATAGHFLKYSSDGVGTWAAPSYNSLAIGTTAGTAMEGNTALLSLGTTSTTALAGDTAYSTLAIGTTSTTAMAGDTSLLQIGTTSTTAMAGDTALLQIGTSSTTALAGDTSYSTLALGTTSTTALAGDTAYSTLAIGTTSTTALAGDTAYSTLAIGTTSTTAMAGDTVIPTYSSGDFTITSLSGFNSSTSNYLRGDGNWVTPPNTQPDGNVYESTLHVRLGQITGGWSDPIYIGDSYTTPTTIRGSLTVGDGNVYVEEVGTSSYDSSYIQLLRSSTAYNGWPVAYINMMGTNSLGQQTLSSITTEMDNSTGSTTTTCGKVYIKCQSNYNNFAQTKITLNSVGVGIRNRTASTYELEVEGDASKSTAGSFQSNSDSRIKTNVETIPDGLGIINQLRPVSFNYTEEYLNSRDGSAIRGDKKYFNFIAQEYEEVFPDEVTVTNGCITRYKDGFDPVTMDPHEKEELEDGSAVDKYVEDVPGLDKIKSITTHAAMIHLVKAVQELSTKNDALEARLAALEAA